MASETRMVGALSLGLLVLMVLMGVIFVVGAQFQKSICNDIDGNYYNDGACQVSATNSTTAESDAFTNVGTVITAIELVLGFLSLIVITLIAKMIINIVRGIKQ